MLPNNVVTASPPLNPPPAMVSFFPDEVKLTSP